jgi:cation transporter-like permease
VDVTPLASQLEAFVNYTCGGNSVQLFVPLTFAYGQTSNQYATYVAMQAVRLYVDPDTVVSVTTFTPTGSTGTLFLTLSGYLI